MCGLVLDLIGFVLLLRPVSTLRRPQQRDHAHEPRPCSPDRCTKRLKARDAASQRLRARRRFRPPGGSRCAGFVRSSIGISTQRRRSLSMEQVQCSGGASVCVGCCRAPYSPAKKTSGSLAARRAIVDPPHDDPVIAGGVLGDDLALEGGEGVREQRAPPCPRAPSRGLRSGPRRRASHGCEPLVVPPQHVHAEAPVRRIRDHVSELRAGRTRPAVARARPKRASSRSARRARRPAPP